MTAGGTTTTADLEQPSDVLPQSNSSNVESPVERAVSASPRQHQKKKQKARAREQAGTSPQQWRIPGLRPGSTENGKRNKGKQKEQRSPVVPPAVTRFPGDVIPASSRGFLAPTRTPTPTPPPAAGCLALPSGAYVAPAPDQAIGNWCAANCLSDALVGLSYLGVVQVRDLFLLSTAELQSVRSALRPLAARKLEISMAELRGRGVDGAKQQLEALQRTAHDGRSRSRGDRGGGDRDIGTSELPASSLDQQAMADRPRPPPSPKASTLAGANGPRPARGRQLVLSQTSTQTSNHTSPPAAVRRFAHRAPQYSFVPGERELRALRMEQGRVGRSQGGLRASGNVLASGREQAREQVLTV
jgi:hypothetical protein